MSESVSRFIGLFLAGLFLVLIIVLFILALLVLVLVQAVVQPLLDLVKDVELLLDLLIIEVFRIEAHLAFELLGVLFACQLSEHLDQVEAGPFAQPVQVLLPSKLLFQLFNLSVPALTEVIRPVSHLSQLLLQFIQLFLL